MIMRVLCDRCGKDFETYRVNQVALHVYQLRRDAYVCETCATVIQRAILLVWPMPSLPEVP